MTMEYVFIKFGFACYFRACTLFALLQINQPKTAKQGYSIDNQ